MMLKRYLALMLLLAAVLAAVTALAAESVYPMDPVHGRLTLDDAWFQKVLTPATLESNEAWLKEQGTALEDVRSRYEEDGVLLEAFDPENSRVLVVSAVQDVNAEEIYDVNAVDEETRRNYRLNHSGDVYYGLQGYHYESATWKNFGGNLGRFLQLKYTLTRDGGVVMRGYQRRTVRNGYTITLDMRVRSGLNSIDIFNPHVPTVPVLDQDQTILEVKYDRVLPPYIAELLSWAVPEACRSAVSKYTWCRRFEGKDDI